MCDHVTLLVLKVRSRDLDNLRAKSFYVCLFMYTEGKFKLSLGIEVQYFSIFDLFFQNQISSVLNFFREVFFLKVQLHGFACLFCKSEAKIDCLRISANFFLQLFLQIIFSFFSALQDGARNVLEQESVDRQLKSRQRFSSFLRKKNKFFLSRVSGYPEIIPGFFFEKLEEFKTLTTIITTSQFFIFDFFTSLLDFFQSSKKFFS